MPFRWPFRRSPDADPGDEAPGRGERTGPPGPRASALPGVTVHELRVLAREGPSLRAGAPRSAARDAATALRILAPGGSLKEEARPGEGWAAFLIAGSVVAEASAPPLDAGDLVAFPAASGLSLGPAGDVGALVLLDQAAAAGPAGRDVVRVVRRDALAGSGFAGVSGVRAVHRSGGSVALRLGPPPGARWTVTGLRCLAVLRGKVTLYDGEEPRDVRALEVALVADPRAPLALQAGTDSSSAVGFGAEGVTIRLG